MATAGIAILPGVASGAGHPGLPPRTPQALLAAIATAQTDVLSGTIVETARLGLPELPSDGRTASSLDLASALTGSHTLRIWIDGPTHQRIAVLGQLSESDIIRSGPDLWIYRSATNAVTHYELGALTPRMAADQTQAANPILDPITVANQLVSGLDPSTQVSVDSTEWVANRGVYQLVLTPRDSRALIGRITIAIDGTTNLPLRVEIFGRNGGAPAFETGFTSIDFAAPSAATFDFQTPAGAQLTEGHVPTHSSGLGAAPSGASAPSGSPNFLGTGWTAVFAATQVAMPNTTSGGPGASLLDLVNRVATSVPEGRILSTSLFSALLTSDGRLYVGAVSPASLQQVAASGRGL